MTRPTRVVVALLALVLLLGLIAGLLIANSTKDDNSQYKGRTGQEQYCHDNGWKYDAKHNTCIR